MGDGYIGIHTISPPPTHTGMRACIHASTHTPQAVVIGGGYIGMEVGAGLATNGLPTSLVFPEDRLLARLLTPQVSQ